MKHWCTAHRRQMVLLGTLLGTLAGAIVGCSGHNLGRTSTRVAVQEPLPAPTSVLETIRIRDVPDGTMLEVAADAPLVWTSYRNAGGDFVLELADTIPGPDLAKTLTPTGGLIEKVSVDLQDMLRRSPFDDSVPPKHMTRITVLTRRDAVHALRSANQTLSLTFTPTVGNISDDAPSQPRGDDRTVTAPVPVPVPAPTRPIETPPIDVETIDPGSETPSPATNRDTPQRGPTTRAPVPREVVAPTTPPPPAPPSAPPGRQLLDVAIEDGAYGRVIRLTGDGPFTATPFRLSAPPRFVIDLPGVQLQSETRTLVVAAGGVARIRLGQFQQQPAIARAVLDLDTGSVEPRLEPVAGGLLIHLPNNP